MKARFLALAALVLGLASCQTEPEGLNVNVGGEVDTTITVTIPDTETRYGSDSNSAVGAFSNVDWSKYTVRYIFEVYYGNTGVQKQVYYTDEKTASFPVRLVPGRDYNFVAWADIVEESANIETNKALPYEEGNVVVKHYNADNLNAITLNSTWVAMDETRDAYTGFHNTTGGEKYTGTSSINIQMTRPFAKLRIVTTDMEQLNDLAIMPSKATVEYTTTHYGAFNAYEGKVIGDSKNRNIKHENFAIVEYDEDVENDADMTLFTDYFFATKEQEVINFSLDVYDQDGNLIGDTKNFRTPIPAQRNYLTTIQGNILTDGNNIKVDVTDAFEGNVDYDADKKETTTTVNTAEEFAAAFDNDSTVDVVVLNGDIDLNDLLTRAAYTALTIKNGKALTIDLNGKKLSGTTTENSGTQELFLVKGNLTVQNGTIEYKHEGENMGWNSMTTIFDITAGGVLNLNGVTAKNLGGSDMGFVAHLNNWGEVTLNVDNCTLESNYVAVRVFNSGYDMNNVTIKNSTLKGGSYAFWVHNYTVADFGTEAKAEAQKALLNLNIYNQGNTFSPDVNGIRYGMTNKITADANGITKTVSEDGTVVTLGSVVENGVVRRGVAGTEENATIKKVVVEEGVGVLYDRTFRRFYALEEVVLPSTLTTIGAAGSGVFQSCTNLKTIVLPEALTVLGKGSFQECSSLESINIPAGVTRIESDALRATGLKSIEFHAGVTYFGTQAFRDCKQLTEVVINAPEFTMEGNTFGIMAAPYTPMTIRVANAEMKAYVESKLTAHAKTYITVVVLDYATTAEELAAKMAEGKDVVLANDLTDAAVNTKAPYGNYYGIAHKGGVFNGGGYTLDFEKGTQNSNGKYDNYGIMTSGGTIKNVAISGVFRGIMIMNPTQDIYVENVTINDPDDYGVCYAINTGEGNGTKSLYVSNSTLCGWTSFGTAIKDAHFTGCSFGQGKYYNNVFGRLVKPYVNTVFDGCNFCSKYYIDLSALEANQKVIVKNCTVNGVKITAANWTSLVAPEDTCDEGQISVELKNGTYLTAENVADYIVFE